MLGKFKNRFKNDKLTLVIICIYLALCLASGIYSFSMSNVRNGLMSILFMLIVPLIFIGEKLLKIRFVPIFVMLLLMLSLGGILGTCYEFYILIPYFDSILHGMAGFIFACLGFSIMALLVRDLTNNKRFLSCLFFGIAFSLSIAVIWELFEYSTTFLGFDMLEDTIINHFDSYLLAGSHSEVVSVDGIYQTIIYYGNGESLLVNGYLDIGLYDTIHDMIICLIGTVLFVITGLISYFFYPKLNQLIIPSIE